MPIGGLGRIRRRSQAVEVGGFLTASAAVGVGCVLLKGLRSSEGVVDVGRMIQLDKYFNVVRRDGIPRDAFVKEAVHKVSDVIFFFFSLFSSSSYER